MTMLDDFLADRLAEMTESAKGNDGHAAMCRLMLRIDNVELTHWLHAEQERGTPMALISDALSNYIAHLLAPLCIPQDMPELAACKVLIGAEQAFRWLLTSEDSGAVGIAVAPDGRQEEVTITGVVKQGFPK